MEEKKLTQEEYSNLLLALKKDTVTKKGISSIKIWIILFFFIVFSSLLTFSSFFFSLYTPISPIFQSLQKKEELMPLLNSSWYKVLKWEQTPDKKECSLKETTNVFEQTKQIEFSMDWICYTVSLELKEKHTPIKAGILIISLTLLFAFFFLIRNRELIYRIELLWNFGEMEPFLNKYIRNLSDFLEKYSHKLSYLEFKLLSDKLYQHLFILIKEKRNVNLIPLIYTDIVSRLSQIWLKDKNELIRIQQGLLEREWFLIEKRYSSYIWNTLNYITSIYFNSSIQLLFFVSIYLAVNAFILQTIYSEWFQNSSYLFYLTQTTSIASNLWGDISLINNPIELWFSIYLQITWLLLFWILIWVITKKINS